MKSKIKLLVILMLAGFLNAQAQGPRTIEERVKQSVDRVKDSIKLNAIQQTDVGAAFSQFYMAMDQLRSGLAAGERPDKASIEKLLEIRDAKIKLILTEQQFTKFKEMDAAMRQRGQRPQGR